MFCPKYTFMMMYKIRLKGRNLRTPVCPCPALPLCLPIPPTLGKEWAQGLLDREFQCPRNPEEWVHKENTGSMVANHLASWTLYPWERVRSEKGQNGPFRVQDTEQDLTWSILRMIQIERHGKPVAF